MKKHPQSRLLAVTLIAAGLFASAAHAAAPEGWYVGGAVGSLELDNGLDDSGDAETSIHFYFGRQFGSRIAIEAGYLDMGDLVTTPPGGLTGDLRATGFTIAGLGRLPLWRSLNLEGKIGALFWDGNASIPGFRTDPGEINPHASLGFGWDAARRVTLTANWTHHELGALSNNVVAFGLRIGLGAREE